MSRLETKNSGAIRSLAEDLRGKKAVALEEWRAENCNRISWDLFALIIGPTLEHPGDLIPSGPDDVFTHTQLAFFEMVDRVLRYGFDEEGHLENTKMSKQERAFACCLEQLFWRYDDGAGWLLNRGIWDQALSLGLGSVLHSGEMSIAEVVERIDDHRGGPEWRQICETNKDQEEMDSRFGLTTITEIPQPSRPWAESAFQKKRREEMDQAAP
jgi:hypothetical protein